MNQFQKNIALVLTVALVFLLVWQLFNQPKTGTKDINYSEMIAFLDKGEIKELGTHDELLEKRGLYYQLHKMQFQKQEKADLKI